MPLTRSQSTNQPAFNSIQSEKNKQNVDARRIRKLDDITNHDGNHHTPPSKKQTSSEYWLTSEGEHTPESKQKINQLAKAMGAGSPSDIDPTKNMTNTPRHRPVVREKKLDLTRIQPSDSIRKEVRRTLHFNLFTIKEALSTTTSEHILDAASYTTKKFGPFEIDVGDLDKIPARKSVKNQNIVKGKSANAEITPLNQLVKQYDILNKNAVCKNKEVPQELHWCHLLAFCLFAGKIDTQVDENLHASSSKCNWTQKHYELNLRDLLKEKKIKKLSMQAEAKIIDGTAFAKTIELDIKLTNRDDSITSTKLSFDGLSLKTEPKEISDLLLLPLKVFSEGFHSTPMMKMR